MQEVFITTYALTSGIERVILPHDREKFFYGTCFHEIGVDAFHSELDARVKAEQMRARRIREFEAKIERLKNKQIIINDKRGEENPNFTE